MNREEYFAEIDRAYRLPRSAEQEARIRQLCERCAAEYGREHRLYAAMLSELGGFFRGQGRLPEAEECFQQAMQILENACGRDSADYATALNNLAGTHRREGRLALAQEEFRKCLAIYRQSGKETTLLGASCLNNLALALIDAGELGHAAEALDRASGILKLHPGAGREYVSSLINLASLRYRMGEYAQAVPPLSEAVTLLESGLGTETPQYHAALNLLGILEETAGRSASAAEYFRRALTAAEALYEPDHPEVCAIRRRLKSCPEVAT